MVDSVKKNPSDATKPEAPEDSGAGKDVVLVHGVTEDRKGLRVLRARDERLEVGEVRPLADGQPITSDVVKLRPRKEAPFVCDVETTFTSPVSTENRQPTGKRPTKAGPAQVASRAYRDNWDAIWATKISARGSQELN